MKITALVFAGLLLLTFRGAGEQPPKSEEDRQIIVDLTPTPAEMGEHWTMESMNGPTRLHWVRWFYRVNPAASSADFVYITEVQIVDSAEQLRTLFETQNSKAASSQRISAPMTTRRRSASPPRTSTCVTRCATSPAA